MKTFVINQTDNTRIPFLRGILVRSLQDAGLSFEDAWELATEVRAELDEVPEIASSDLRSRVEGHLSNGFDSELLDNYRQPLAAPTRITVTSLSGKESSFSRGRHYRYLLASGLKSQTAEMITDLVYEQLLGGGVEEISTCELGYLTWLCLHEEASDKAAHRYLLWSEFQRSGRPLLLLIGGAVGSGKSTLATDVAHQLEIVRVQSTDMLREVMRMMIPSRLLPVVHRSSYEAWRELPASEIGEREPEFLVAEGYRIQADLLAVSCEAVLQRALREGVSVILEGVHVHPQLVQSLSGVEEAIVVQVMAAVLRPKELKSRLRGRNRSEPSRSSGNYLEHFESIWQLQGYLLSEADRFDVPIIPNDDLERSRNQIIRAIIQELDEHYSGTPEEVFGQVATEGRSADWRHFLTRLVA